MDAPEGNLAEGNPKGAQAGARAGPTNLGGALPAYRDSLNFCSWQAMTPPSRMICHEM